MNKKPVRMHCWAIQRPKGDYGWLEHTKKDCIKYFMEYMTNGTIVCLAWEEDFVKAGYSCVKVTVSEGWT